MKRRDRLGLALFAALALAAGALGSSVARHLESGGRLRLELGRVKPTALQPETVARFERLQDKVQVVYYVSPAARMPAAMRRMELDVTDLLAALRARFPGRFDYQVVDPESREGLEGFSARRRVSPFKVRSVTRDAWDERTVWSTLSIACGPRPEALLQGLGPGHLPHLQTLLVAWLDQLESPRAPRLALAAPEGFEELADELESRGLLARANLDRGEPVPEADLLLWMRPRAVTSEQLRALERMLERGGSVIVAGSLLEVLEDEPEAGPRVRFEAAPSALPELAAHFGLRCEQALVLDENSEELELASKKRKLPYLVRCVAPDQDFQRFAGQPNGTLLFRAATPLAPDPARLFELGWNAEVLATSSDKTSVQEPPAGDVPLEALLPGSGEARAKQALAVGLYHDDPGRGRLVFLGADTPFANGWLSREHVAHRRLVDVLVDEATSDERLVLAGAPLARAEPLPPLAAPARLLARALCIGLPVLALLAAALAGGVFSPRSATGGAFGRSLRRFALCAGAVLVVRALTRGLDAAGLALDASSLGVNSLSPATRAVAARAGEQGEIEVELLLSAPDRLPPELWPWIGRLEDGLRDLERAGARLAVRRRVPEDLDEAERAALAARGIVPLRAATSAGEVQRVTSFFAYLCLSRGGRAVQLAFPDARACERLEFRLAFACERLAGFPVPKIAFASDVPRLSAAEAFEQFQQKGLFAPRGSDVFALARESLAAGDLEVTHVNPRAPVLPEEADVLVWLQPRRSVEAMLEETVRHLRGGGRVVLAAQHFNILSQQFRGGDFELRYWPRPQNPDVESLYFPELSIELVREVLFDELALPIQTDTQLTGRQAGRDVERQSSALPFQIRAPASGFAPGTALTRDLGDQAFLWANRLRWDEEQLAELGLTATPFVFTSGRTWSFAWKGGWIPHELLRGPAELEGSSGAGYLGPQPLAVLFTGIFPEPAGPLVLAPAGPAPLGAEKSDEHTPPVGSPATAGESVGSDAPGVQVASPGSEPPSPEEPPAASTTERPWPEPAPGELVFLGCSEFLENERLTDPVFRGDQLLWNATATLAFGDGEAAGPARDLCQIATRHRTLRGFGYVEPRSRLLWRGVVVAGGPLALLALGGLAALLRSRASVTGRTRP